MGLSDVLDFCCNGTIEKFDKFVTQRNQVEKVQLPKSQTCFKKKRSMLRIPRTLRGGPVLLDSLTGGSSCTNQSSPFRAPSRLVCRQFWKAGHHSFAQASKRTTQNKGNYLHVHPEFLHSNATSHKWVFGAIAELLDNAVDEIENGATYVNVDRRTDPCDRSPALLIQDDCGGMDQDAMRQCMSFGFSDKKLKLAIGQYGNGFKTSSMRLGADVIVFSCHKELDRSTTYKRRVTRSIGLLSYTCLRRMGFDRVVVPMVAVTILLGFLKEAPCVDICGFNVYHWNRLVLPFWRVLGTTNVVRKGVVGILEANFIDPTHKKQDFERTSLFQKLEARLKAMTAEYWRLHCGLIGYQTSKKALSKKLLLQSLHPGGDICKEHDAGNGNSYRHDIPERSTIQKIALQTWRGMMRVDPAKPLSNSLRTIRFYLYGLLISYSLHELVLHGIK